MTQQSHCWAYTPKKPELKDTCTPMFITALFIIARTWKQPRCSSADEWIKKLWYIYTMKYYSTIKKNEFVSSHEVHEASAYYTSEVSQKEKNNYHVLTYTYGI